MSPDQKSVIRDIAVAEAEKWDQDPNGIHGLPHWEIVGKIAAILLAANGHNPVIGTIFGLLHDCQRQNDDHDPEHGYRAARFAETIREKIPLDDYEFAELLDAMEIHHQGWTAKEPSVVGCCCDADRLDLGRVGIEPSAEFLATPQAQSLVNDTHAFIESEQGTLLSLWHGSHKLEDSPSAGDNLRVIPQDCLSPSYFTEDPVICQWYGPAHKVLLVCHTPVRLTDIGAILKKPEFLHLKEVSEEMKDSLPEAFRESGEPFCLFTCLEAGSLYYELDRRGSEEVMREIFDKGYDALCIFDDSGSHSGEDGETVPTWVTFNSTTSILKFPTS